MKTLFLFLFIVSLSYSQDVVSYTPDYFLGKELHCPTENAESKKNFDDGVKLLHLNYNLEPKYLKLNADIFAKAILKDTTFCDAYFFCGYTLNLLKKYREAFAFHKVADKFSPYPILLYKQNLAAICLKLGMAKEARESYQEMVTYFPQSPEGYYGLALLSTSDGDVDKGLENIKTAYTIYSRGKPNVRDDVNLLYGILLTMNNKHSEAIKHFEECSSTFKKLDDFNYNYSYSLLKTAQTNNDEKMKKKAYKIYQKIVDSRIIKPEIAAEFKL